jgi:putative ABC transport system substrate-binding protein
VVLVLFSLGLCLSGYAATVALVTNADNPDYKTARDSFEQALKKESVARNVPVDFVFIDGKGNKDDFIAQIKKIEKDVALIFVAGTPNAVALKEGGIAKPVIFSAVAGPVKAQLVNSLEKPGTNFTGVHCAVPEDRQLKALQLVLPKAKKIGLLYNPADPSVAGQAGRWKTVIAEKGLEAVEFFIPETVNSADTLAEAVKPMIGKVDVILTTADAKVSPYGEGMIKIAEENAIPTYTSLTSLVRKGSLVSLGFDFAEGAKLSAPQALDIIAGKNPAEMPVLTFPQYKLLINMKAAQKIKVDVPIEAVKVASEIIKE